MPRSVDKVRFYLGDTVSTDQLVTDEEITFALSEAGNSLRGAAAICADRLASYYARLADLSEGQLSIKYSQRFQQFRTMAESLATVDRAAQASVTSLPTAGAILTADKTSTEEDTTLVKPSFTVDILDNPDTSAESEEEQP